MDNISINIAPEAALSKNAWGVLKRLTICAPLGRLPQRPVCGGLRASIGNLGAYCIAYMSDKLKWRTRVYTSNPTSKTHR
eukprot:1966836-Prymnesium_polylepis.1